MKSIREILRLYVGSNLSSREVEQSLGISRSAVLECVRRAKGANITWEQAQEMEDDELEGLLYRKSEEAIDRPLPDFNYVQQEMKKKGVTLTLLWLEYKQANPDGYQYTKFTKLIKAWEKSHDFVMRQRHKAGHKAFSDFSGGTLQVFDAANNSIRTARLFVCTLGASNYTYAEPFFSESSESWCTGQANAFEYFGGVPKIVVPDNPKAVIAKADFFEPEISPDFLQMSNHFGVAVLPARVRKPKDKAKVENAVLLCTRWILAVLRNRVFLDLAEAKSAVRELVDQFNQRPFKKLPGSRKSLFQKLEQAALRSLPSNRYEHCKIRFAKVLLDYHVEEAGCHYSVPHVLVGQKVEVRTTTKTVEIFFNNRRVASHRRLSTPGESSTSPQHMPASHRAYEEWTPAKVSSWAEQIGPATSKLIAGLFASYRVQEQALRASLGILRLSKEYSPQILEQTCELANNLKCYSLKNIRLILKNQRGLSSTAESPEMLVSIVHENLRGANYFGKEEENVATSHH